MSLILAVVIVTIGSSCGTRKYLKEGETFLEQNSVKIKSELNVQDKGELKEDLLSLAVQKPNRNWLWVPRQWFYYQISNKSNKEYSKWFQRQQEAPAIFDSTMCDQTLVQMENYLKERGYFNALADYSYETFDNSVTSVEYTVRSKARYQISAFNYECVNEDILKILEDHKDDALLKVGTAVDIQLYEQERSRITNLLQNNGYAFFQKREIGSLKVDSTGGSAIVSLRIKEPNNPEAHSRFYFGKVEIYPDYDPSYLGNYEEIEYDGIRFYYREDINKVKEQTIAEAIYFKKGDLYTKEVYDRSFLKLNSLDAYRFVSFQPEIDSIENNSINYKLFLTKDKKMSTGGNIEINYSDNTAQLNLFGAAANLNLTQRNFLGGSETFVNSVGFGVEFDLLGSSGTPSNDTLFGSSNFNWQSDLYIPKFLDIFGIYKGLNKIRIKDNGLLRDGFYEELITRANTKVSGSYNWVSIRSLYSSHSFNLALGYQFNSKKKTQYSLNHIGFNLYLPTAEPRWQTTLDAIPTLERSWSKQLFTGLLFRDFSWQTIGKPNRAGVLNSFLGLVELSGAEIYTANVLYNLIDGGNEVFSLGNPADPLYFSKYIKTELQWRQLYNFSRKHKVSFRFLGGIIVPFGVDGEEKINPYVKQFFGGGPSGIRAWRLREMGPGGNNDPGVQINGVDYFFQSGDIRLEANIEYRFDLFWYLKGALFVDAGNIWLLKEDKERPGSGFSEDFINQIAVGAGFGLRLDFSYFLMRIDIGYKLRTPYLNPTTNSHYYYSGNAVNFKLNDGTLQWGIGYPF